MKSVLPILLGSVLLLLISSPIESAAGNPSVYNRDQGKKAGGPAGSEDANSLDENPILGDGNLGRDDTVAKANKRYWECRDNLEPKKHYVLYCLYESAGGSESSIFVNLPSMDSLCRP
ncbi:hypothetical protein PtA15_7A417 [Puccinia triticina]|uniref:Uncharacterized protein n=1 Tax=Puccinia triticina TaxID=208348 RepID=A0ABY7CNF3_9BASI|nr:uncharacterized protein PtA15_7A417 [Puccinia triticina]WAQ86689.1 hypothetical protein PtA15_7A417 [Puccinia triticina]WAR56555.1 hypothetical protein PtB15_7B404 [Puccinia triticina]